LFDPRQIGGAGSGAALADAVSDGGDDGMNGHYFFSSFMGAGATAPVLEAGIARWKAAMAWYSASRLLGMAR